MDIFMCYNCDTLGIVEFDGITIKIKSCECVRKMTNA
jgi:hypothetical protein